jgi:hypothetical protein
MKESVQTVTVLPNGKQESSNPVDEETIRCLAYELWRARGCPTGSAKVDWFAAERQLKKPVQTAAAA